MTWTRIPPEVGAVEGCSCGGRVCHVQECMIWSLPRDQAQAAEDEARRRVMAYSTANFTSSTDTPSPTGE